MPTHDTSTLIIDMEQAIEQRLSDLVVSTFDLNDEPAAVKCPAVNVGLWDGSLRPANKSRTLWDLTLGEYVTVMVANPKSKEARRRDVYPLVMAIISRLVGWTPTLLEDGTAVDLGFNDPMPTRLRKSLDSKDKIAFTIELSVSKTISVMREEEIRLLKLALDFMLKPGDDVADATGQVDFTP